MVHCLSYRGNTPLKWLFCCRPLLSILHMEFLASAGPSSVPCRISEHSWTVLFCPVFSARNAQIIGCFPGHHHQGFFAEKGSPCSLPAPCCTSVGLALVFIPNGLRARAPSHFFAIRPLSWSALGRHVKCLCWVQILIFGSFILNITLPFDVANASTRFPMLSLGILGFRTILQSNSIN